MGRIHGGRAIAAARALAVLLAGTAWVGSCSGRGGSAGTPAAQEEPWSTAFITGRVHFSGFRPVPAAPIRVEDLDSGLASMARDECGEYVPQKEGVVVNADCTLKNVFIQLKAGLPDEALPVPSEPVVLDRHRGGPPSYLLSRPAAVAEAFAASETPQYRA